MNTFPPKVKSLRIIAIAALLAGTPLAAHAADNGPEFSLKRSASSATSLSVTAFNRGKFEKSVALSRRALKQGQSKSRKSITYSNLCAALGAQGLYDEALEACDTAISLKNDRWQAHNNRAAVNWLAGRHEEARQDIEKANVKDADTPVIVHNIKVFG